MFRYLLPVFKSLRPIGTSYLKTARIVCNSNTQHFSTLQRSSFINNYAFVNGALTSNEKILDISKNLTHQPVRTVTKFSMKRGKRKTVKAAVARFFRLHWGGWIRTKAGRQKKLWKKSSSRRRRLREHVLVNATQATMLDKMVTNFWKRPKYYVDDPYEPYHKREEFMITRRRPLVRD